jgi:hypothetical protein
MTKRGRVSVGALINNRTSIRAGGCPVRASAICWIRSHGEHARGSNDPFGARERCTSFILTLMMSTAKDILLHGQRTFRHSPFMSKEMENQTSTIGLQGSIEEVLIPELCEPFLSWPVPYSYFARFAETV